MSDELNTNAPANQAGDNHNAAVTQSGDGQQTTQQGAQSTAPTPAPQPGIGREDIAEIVTQAVKAVQPQQQMTQEQIDAALRVYRPTTKTVEKIQQGGEAALEALNEIVQGIYNQATTMAEYRLKMQTEPIMQQIAPLQEQIRQHQLNSLKEEFFARNKDLVGFDPILNAIQQQLTAEGARFATKDEAFKAVGDRARAIIKTLPGVGQANNGQSQQTQQNVQPHSMSTLTGGGQGGTSQGQSGQPVNKYAWQDLGV